MASNQTRRNAKQIEDLKIAVAHAQQTAMRQYAQVNRLAERLQACLQREAAAAAPAVAPAAPAPAAPAAAAVAPCPPGKVRNPATGRCVNATGAIGKKIGKTRRTRRMHRK